MLTFHFEPAALFLHSNSSFVVVLLLGLTLGTVALTVSATVTSGVDYPHDLEDQVPPLEGTIVLICG